MKREEVTRALKDNIAIFSDFVRDIPEDKLHIKRGEGFWTIHQHIYHLVMAQKMILGRVKLFLQDVRPAIVPFHPEENFGDKTGNPRPVTELLEYFQRWRTEQVEIMVSASDEIWQRTIEHPEYDLYTFNIMARHVLVHDGFHMHRIEELWLMKNPFISKM